MVCEQGAFWKTVLPKCHGFRTLTGSILKNSTPKMPWFANRDDSGPVVKCVICPSLALLAKDSIQLRNRQNQCIMLKFHLFPRDSSKDAVLGPAKLPSGLELRSAALGQFCRPLDGIFSRVPRKKVEFWPRNQGSAKMLARMRAATETKMIPETHTTAATLKTTSRVLWTENLG